MLESTIRDLFLLEPRIELIEEANVSGLLSSATNVNKAINGITYMRRGDESAIDLSADLVVDASGANSKAGQWLKAIDIDPPMEKELDPLLTYGGQLFRMKEGARFPKSWWWTHGAFIQRVPPVDNVAAHLIRQEGDLWLLCTVCDSKSPNNAVVTGTE